MTYEAACEIFEGMSATVRGEVVLEAALQNLVRSAVRYARLRTDWQLAGLDEKTEMDQQRTRAHNAFSADDVPEE